MDAPFVALPDVERFAATSVAHYCASTAVMVSLGALVLFASTGSPASLALVWPLVFAGLGLAAGRKRELARARSHALALLVIGAGSVPLLLPGSGAELFLASNLPALFIWYPQAQARARWWAIGLVGGEFLALAALTHLGEWHVFTPATEQVAWWVVHIMLPVDLVVTLRTLLEQHDHQQRSLERARDQAMDVARTKTRIMNSIAHELRTPLAAAFGLLSDLEDGQKDDRISESKHAVERVLARTTDLLDLARLDGESAPRLQARSVAAPAALLRALGVESFGLEVGVGMDAPHRFDVPLVRRVLGHLVENAHRHGVEPISVKGERVGDTLVFEVADAGAGIPRERRERVFEPFESHAEGLDDASGGAGVGLPVSKRLVQAAGGALEVLDRKEGCALRLTVPAEPAADRVAAEPSVPLNLKVLVVEDEALNRKIVRRFLERLGCQVDEVVDGLLAVEQVRKERYHLILMDVRMPRMDGLTATRVIKQAIDAPPVVALTANALAGDRERCFEAGMDGFLAKPFKSDAFLTALGDLATVVPSPSEPS